MTNFLSEFQVMRQIFFFIFLFGFLGWCVIFSKNVSAEQQYTEIEVVDGGNVIGNVKYVGDLGAVVLNLYRDWELSDTSKILSEKLIFSKINNGLKNAAVSVKDITKGKKKGISTIHPIIDQQSDIFIPHVIPILTGTTIDILHGDEGMHNIHTSSIMNQPFNLGTTYKQRISKKFDYPEIIKLTWQRPPDQTYLAQLKETGSTESRDMICHLELIVENHTQVRHRCGERYCVQLQFDLIDVDF